MLLLIISGSNSIIGSADNNLIIEGFLAGMKTTTNYVGEILRSLITNYVISCQKSQCQIVTGRIKRTQKHLILCHDLGNYSYYCMDITYRTTKYAGIRWEIAHTVCWPSVLRSGYRWLSWIQNTTLAERDLN